MNTLFGTNFQTEDSQLAHMTVNVRSFLENLWQKYYPNVRAEEKAFRGDLRTQAHARIWEMYIAVALFECGLNLIEKHSKGPDVHLCTPTVWVEAVASTDGKGVEKSTQPLSRVSKFMLPEWSGGPPVNQMTLRWLTSINEKMKKLNGYIQKAVVRETDPYVVAVNTHKTSFSILGHLHTRGRPPTIAFVFGYPDQATYLTLYSKGGVPRPRPLGFVYPYQSQITKDSGIEVRADIFLQDMYSNISALIVSNEGIMSWERRIPDCLSEEFAIVHNPIAKNRLPKPWLKSGHEIWIERRLLHKSFWKDGEERNHETFTLPHGLPDDLVAMLDRYN